MKTEDRLFLWIQDVYKRQVVEKVKKTAPLYDFVAEDGIGHRVYRIVEAEDIAAIEEAFAKIKEIYIADGHHLSLIHI